MSGEDRKLGVIFLEEGLEKPWQVSFKLDGEEVEVLPPLTRTRNSPFLRPITSRWFRCRKYDSVQPGLHFLPGWRLRVAEV